MRISFVPVRRDDRLKMSCVGDVLTLNGDILDFSSLPDGAILPRSAISNDWIAGDVERLQGQLHLSVMLPHGAKAPAETLFPIPVETTDGEVPVPPFDLEPTEIAEEQA
ncbi:hypothetical protein [Falsiruegeria mediterranea]|uniref:Uncharacterized protein n=1 Tax=Falsiruegeria mediterranea M17 TaxID=1200281 RepID=A0A2R8CG04_9RHOB|nr:hypothetical protein [Falsiruegeria mediterranea]SPJ31350.1 hypothetical protein TRM7615_04893 [Falsiruegeria mediterranea M17]